jgi:hypothetical protein
VWNLAGGTIGGTRDELAVDVDVQVVVWGFLDREEVVDGEGEVDNES